MCRAAKLFCVRDGGPAENPHYVCVYGCYILYFCMQTKRQFSVTCRTLKDTREDLCYFTPLLMTLIVVSISYSGAGH
jgi:hypothetical protein